MTDIMITPPPIVKRSIVMSVSVCLSVCLCVCPQPAIISSELHVRSSLFFVRVAYGCGSVLPRGRSDMLRISGFIDDVIFAHKLRLFDVAARPKKGGSQAALDLARRNTRCRLPRTLGTTSRSQGLSPLSIFTQLYFTTNVIAKKQNRNIT